MNIVRLFDNFWDDSGQVAVIFALAIIPIFAVAGFAIDFQNTIKKKQKVQIVLDSAVLAAARSKQTGAEDATIKLVVQEFVDAQVLSMGGGFKCGATNTKISRPDDAITSEITCSQETTLSRVIGKEQLDFRVDATAEYGIDKLDVAFMFDISGSMNGSSRLTNLKAAAKEAVDVLLPAGASPELIEDTRLAMVSYNTMVNAGPFFEDVTGVPAKRTYTHTIKPTNSGISNDKGRLFSDLHIGLYDASRNRLITEFGDDAAIAIEDWRRDNRTEARLTIGVKVPKDSPLYKTVGSMRLELSGVQRRRRNDNDEPFSLYGDRRGEFTSRNGRNWREGKYRLRLRAYERRNRRGRLLFDETLDFELGRAEDSKPQVKEITISSTCVWERDGAQKFTDAAPGSNAYLAHQQAWFVEDPKHRDGGYWKTGHPNRPDHSWYRGTECRNAVPVGLTNKRSDLISYVNSLNAGGGTAGHLGVAWSWYLVSPNWSGVFLGSSAPLAYTEPDANKVVILMTDGAFNAEIFPEQGSSSTQARALCDSMKRQGIQVYAVALNAPTSGKRVLEYCASGPEHFFEPSNADELTDAYRKIATSISDLRISK
ncbi:MAG: VWA domain-containing protein [Henriciella sp.]|jgi:Flp pilus assembly protein TadG|nr:VWA domain-containing protein [Henriciella sp.]MBO6695279.1 VWA domain-containing protein [Henriciella sp.]